MLTVGRNRSQHCPPLQVVVRVGGGWAMTDARPRVRMGGGLGNFWYSHVGGRWAGLLLPSAAAETVAAVPVLCMTRSPGAWGP